MDFCEIQNRTIENLTQDTLYTTTTRILTHSRWRSDRRSQIGTDVRLTPGLDYKHTSEM